MRPVDTLVEEYHNLLQRHGLRSSEPTVAGWQRLESEIENSEKRFGPTSDRLIGQLRQIAEASDVEGQVVNVNQVILQRNAQEVERLMVHSYSGDVLRRTATYVNEFPTGEINAEAIWTENGFLILVNVGLINFLEMMTSLMFGHLLRTQTQGSSQSDSDAADILYWHTVKYLTREPPPARNVNTQLFALDVPTAVIYSYFKNACLKFVLAHEYAHIAAGHFDQAQDHRPLSTTAGVVRVLKKSWLQEYEADSIAVKALLWKDPAGARSDATLPIRIAAPFFFFYLEEFLLKASVTMGLRTETNVEKRSHPPPERRRENVAACIRDATQLTRDSIDFADRCRRWIGTIGARVLMQARVHHGT